MTQKEALNLLKTGANVFLTGEPGSGKTHTIREYIRYLRDHSIEPAIAASTGIAATHIGGLTIHSWAGIGIRESLSAYDLDKIASSEYVAKRINKTKVLIIDEISMLSPNTLSMIEAVCREVKQNEEIFGGLQVVFVGDFFQLPPIDKQRGKFPEKFQEDLFADSDSQKIFAYESDAWKKAKPIICYLSEQHRQDDEKFLYVLKAIRADEFGEDHFAHIEGRKIKLAEAPENIPRLFTHNVDVDRFNNEELSKLPTEVKTFDMQTSGNPRLIEGLKNGCLSPERLVLKKGAVVMFTKNNPKEGYVNGTVGEVVGFSSFGMPEIQSRNGKVIEPEPAEWSVEDNGKIKARITQLPLRLAWAITVHKSQGMSLDSVVLDLSSVFEFGQGYVALSRVRRLSGLFLTGIGAQAFKIHPNVLAQDAYFRTSSHNAETVLTNTGDQELSHMHENFIKAIGGRSPKEKIKGEKNKKEKGHGFDEIRKTHPNAFRSWKKEDDEKLKKLFSNDSPISELAEVFGRKPGAIQMRLAKLGLIELDE